MRKVVFIILFGTLIWLTSQSSHGHQEPTSFLELHFENDGLKASLVASVADLAHELEEVEPHMLLSPPVLQQQEKRLTEILLSRLSLVADGVELSASKSSATPVPDRDDIRFDFIFNSPPLPREIAVKCRLFPYDTRHRTYLNIYQGKSLSRQEVFEGNVSTAAFSLLGKQDILKVIREFTYEGVRHIFIGPDHILFVIGLLLLGGGLGRLLRIITAFTIAHSITLCLATFQIISPPASLVEPVIALSIVVVGIHAFLGNELRDPRLWFAFSFGLIHGFGFASVLQEMELPRHALGVSLFSFNLGVEIGQACIILAVAPLLALLRNRKPIAARHVTQFAALSVTTAGAFWFFQRLM
jgi:hydrogenase/urease accessory protein HupE